VADVLTIYASIGNSDDKLSQHEWSVYVRSFVNTVHRYVRPGQVHGIWHSFPDDPYQNACICFEATPEQAADVRRDLEELRQLHRQDSIAWATAQTEFI
jgi:hypothetical protein